MIGWGAVAAAGRPKVGAWLRRALPKECTMNRAPTYFALRRKWAIPNR